MLSTNKANINMTREGALASFRSYEVYIDSLVKKGEMGSEEAFKHLDSARKNYRSLNYNREIDKIRRD